MHPGTKRIKVGYICYPTVCISKKKSHHLIGRVIRLPLHPKQIKGDAFFSRSFLSVLFLYSKPIYSPWLPTNVSNSKTSPRPLWPPALVSEHNAHCHDNVLILCSSITQTWLALLLAPPLCMLPTNSLPLPPT